MAEITSKIKVGLERIETTECGVSNTAQAMKSGTLPVFATPAMTGLMEQAASNLAEILLPEGWTSVGTKMNVEHTSATPFGMKVKAQATVVSVDNRMITFDVKAVDASGEIGHGTHERVVVQKSKFLDKALAKINKK
ncbi:MAG: thioesterase family protein [Schwartzia sp.]|nr:thioesterase family protein [Schwartzia sp. (in: firmicutes)]